MIVRVLLFAFGLSGALAAPALAHAPGPGLTGFAGGLVHPLVVPAHALALAGLGFLIAQQGYGRSVAVALAIGLVAGLGVLWFGVVPRYAAVTVLVCAGIAGLALAWDRTRGWALPEKEARVLALVAGFAVGLDSPPEVVSLSVANRMLAGAGIGALLVTLAVAFAAGRLAGPQAIGWRPTAVRVLGAIFAVAAFVGWGLRLAF
jgi:urease accessory protein